MKNQKLKESKIETQEVVKSAPVFDLDDSYLLDDLDDSIPYQNPVKQDIESLSNQAQMDDDDFLTNGI